MNGPAPTRRLSPWGAVVAISALLVVGAAAALLIAGVASRRERIAEWHLARRGRRRRGDRRRRAARAARGAEHRPLRLRPPRGGQQDGVDGGAAAALALPEDRAAFLLVALSPRRARQCPGRRARLGGHRASAGLSRLGAGHPAPRRHR